MTPPAALPYKPRMDPLHIALRWTHVVAVIVMVGGAFFIRVVLLPLIARLPQGAATSFRSDLMKRWMMVLRACMVFIIVSGFYNFLVVMRPRHAGQPEYDALLIIKIALAFGVFGVAESLVRKDPAKWLTVNLLLAAVVVALSSAAKFMPLAHP